ncbi:MAG: hypothetical protein J5548_06115 [Prevotella sp.]|nr:hypothetical protein [Prevotella sp.]
MKPEEEGMKIKKLLCYSYRVIEILLILSITAGLIALGLHSHDKEEMGGLLSPLIVALAWMWFISLPLLIILVASFIRSIPPSTSYKKAVLSLHIINVVLWFLIYYLLPKPAPCDAALMENHFKTHQDNMYDLVRYVRSSLNDSCSIVLLYRNDEVQEFTIRNRGDCKEQIDMDDKRELETVLQTAGLSMQEFSVIQEKMHKAGVIGFEIGKNLFPYWEPGKSVLLFRWHGVNRYQFALYDHPMTEEERHEVMSLFQHVLYNDSVVFESFGGYPGMRGFPDRDEFLSTHGYKAS